jgi:chaperonin GroES
VTTLKLNDIATSQNVALLLSEEEVKEIGDTCLREYRADKFSRAEWEDRYAEAMKMALQVMEEKTFPWAGASNVKFPLITIAAMQFHARAYPATIPSSEVVGCRVIGEDLDGKKQARADRIAEHMSYQRMEEDTQWEESHDKLLLAMSILGCAFKKTYYDSTKEVQISELVLPKDLVVDYYAKSLETASRVTHVLYLSPNTLWERQKAGMYLETSERRETPEQSGPIEAVTNEVSGLTQPATDKDTPYKILEQHRFLDLDDDGYAEPYIVLFREDTGEVLRIVARFYKENIRYDEKVQLQKIIPESFFTKFSFIPSPDGGFYDMGFGLLLGGLSASIDSLINQLIDAGTMSNTAGGFLGKGVKIRGGDYSFRPNEWKRTDSTGEDLVKNIFPLPVREPNAALLQLLTLLIDFGTKIGMATDPMVGVSPGQNTPAETSRNTIAQGEKVFNSIYKRTYRAMREEFRKCYRLNYFYPPANGRYEYGTSNGQGGVAYIEDYYDTDKGVVPSADPFVTSDEMKTQQAMLLAQRAGQVAGYDKYQVEKRLHSALKVEGTELLFPNPKGPKAVAPPPNPKMQIEQMRMQNLDSERKYKQMKALLDLQEEARLNDAKIAKLHADAAKLMSEVQGAEAEQKLKAIELQIQHEKNKQDGMLSLIDLIKETQNGNSNGMGGMAGNGANKAPDGMDAQQDQGQAAQLGAG